METEKEDVTKEEYKCDCDPPGTPATKRFGNAAEEKMGLPIANGRLVNLMKLPKFAKLSFLNSFDTILFDCDGVLWKSGEEIPGASQFVNTMQRKGKRCIFLTNNSTRSRTTVAQHAAKFGFQVKDTDFVTTAYLCGQYLNEEANFDRRKKIYVIGCDGIHEELRNAGFNTSFGLGDAEVGCDWSNYTKNLRLEDCVGAVIVGFDPYYSFAKILNAASYIKRPDVLFIGTNTDEAFPHKDKNLIIPGSGVMINGVVTCLGREPDVILGKPHPYMAETAKRLYNLNLERTIMVGDRANTDIVFGKRMGVRTLLVLTGITTVEESEKWLKSFDIPTRELVADYYVNSIADFNPYLDEL